MKKQLLTLAFSLFYLASYAQKTFTEAMFADMMSRLQTDPAFVKNEVDPSLTITYSQVGGTAMIKVPMRG